MYDVTRSTAILMMASKETKKNYKNAPSKYTSKVWKYFGFSIKDESKVVCKTCSAELKYSGGTTNLNVHLRRHHGIDISEKHEKGNGYIDHKYIYVHPSNIFTFYFYFI